MPAAQLVSSIIEQVLNKVCELSPDTSIALLSLEGSQLKVSVNELPWPIIFAFSDKIDILIDDTDAPKEVDCHIALSLESLQLMQDSSQITQLIKQNKLTLEGDIHIAQGFSQLIKDIHIDWEEVLSQYTGDVVAHSVMRFGKQALQTAKANKDKILSSLAEGALEEKHIAAHKSVVTAFCDDVDEVRSDVARLEARLTKLEKH